jgi:hypothetical protein
MFTKLLNNSFKNYWHLCTKRTCINNTIVRADCKFTGLHFGWNKRKLGFGEIQVTYLNVNFGLRLGQARPGKILKFWPVQTSKVNNTE